VRDGIINYLNIFRSGDSGGFWELGGGRWAVCGWSVEMRKQKASPQIDGRNGTRECHTCHGVIGGAGGAVFIKEGQQTITAKSWVKVPL